MRKKTSRPRVSASAAAGLAAPAATSTFGVLIAVELGAEFPILGGADGSLRRVLAQKEGESPSAFADRVANALDGLFGRGLRLGQLALACNERIDDAAMGARRKLAGLVLGAMAKHQAGKVFLTSPANGSGRLRHALSALAQGLFEEWRTAGLEVSVDFGDESRSVSSAAPFIYTARVA